MASGFTTPRIRNPYATLTTHDDNDWCCSVCKEKFRDKRVLPCGHFICGPLSHPCIRRVREENQGICPVEGCGNVIPTNFNPFRAPRPQEKQPPATYRPATQPSFYEQKSSVTLGSGTQNHSGREKENDPRLKQATSELSKSKINLCRVHRMSLEFYCSKCIEKICLKCWTSFHLDKSRHDVAPHVTQNDLTDRIGKYKDECENTSDIMKKFDIVLQGARDLKQKYSGSLRSNASNNLMTVDNAQLQDIVEHQKQHVNSLQAVLNIQFSLLKEQLENLIPAQGESVSGPRSVACEPVLRDLKSVRAKVVSENIVACSQAIYNSTKREILCLEQWPGTVRSLSVYNKQNRMELDRTMEWDKVRTDKSELNEIAMASDNILYASIRNNIRWRVSVLRQNDLKEEREIDTKAVKEQDVEIYKWRLNARGKNLAIVTNLDNNKQKVFEWQCAYVYFEETLAHIVPLYISRSQFSSTFCYTGQNLILETRNNAIAAVLIDSSYCNLQKDLVRQSQIPRDVETPKVIKHITLQDTKEIRTLVWLDRSDNVEMNSDGYLFAGDYTYTDANKSSVYQLNLDAMIDGDEVTSYKDWETKSVFPHCVIDSSTLFGIKGNFSFKGNPSSFLLEYE
ncbi:uncharacterized protein LOC142346207 isoform X2 [Convolutriloba macropyga]|uniref:uncharacterized protein LOC142346207 isoform X2 n=1 Tax=Convolutriloba macropyga TaxID=536237 RepID=UPI003F51FD1A